MNTPVRRRAATSFGADRVADAADAEFVLRLYVSGGTAASARAVVNTRRLCEQHLKDRYRLEILNIADHIDAARRDQIVAAPTLVKLLPMPLRRFIGDMSDVQRVLLSLGMAPAAS